MNTAKTAKNAAKFALDPFEYITSQTKPILDETKKQILPFFDSPRLGGRPREIASQELARAREAQNIKISQEEDEKASIQKIQSIRETYKGARMEGSKQQSQLRQELAELQTEVVQLAKTAGVDTKIHMENTPKVGKIDIKFLTFIIRILRVKAEQSKSAKDLVSERQNAKRSTGMLAWVSGKQMKIHEQGTLQLQG